MKLFALTLALFAVGALALAVAPPKPPATRVVPVREVVHGVEIVDDYRWLEGDNSKPDQMGAMTPEVSAWIDAQNEHTRSVLGALPGRQQVEDRLRPLMEIGSVSAPRMRGNRYFYSEREGTQNQPIVYWREGYKGERRVLIDPAQLDPSGLTAVPWFSPSHDGKLVAYGSYRAGDENTVLHLLEVDSGKLLPLEIPGRTEAPDWLPDGSGFVYHNLADVKNPYSGQIEFHRLGSDPKSDAQLFRQLTPQEDAKLATTWGPFGGLSRDGRWLELGYSTGTRSNDLWFADFEKYRATGKLEKVELLRGKSGNASGPIVGDTLYLQTKVGAPNGQVVAIDLRRPAEKDWKVLVPERADAVVEAVSVAKGILVVEYLAHAASRFELFGLDGRALGELKLPGIGSAGLSTEEDRTEAYLSFTSFNYPTTIFRVDLAKPQAEPELWARPAVPVDPTTVEVEQVWYPSKDGTQVSMFLAHKKGLPRDGNTPTLLSGYGGFGISETPVFAATLFQWYELGGVYAVPNLRGGGEYGDAWHEAGMLVHKQNVFDDFAAAAQWLVVNRITSPARLAIAGGSNGGLLTGAALVQHPEMFGAVISAVPLLDMLRYQNFLMARYWVPEYGSAEDASQLAFLRAYSPYHNLDATRRYPAVMLTAGEHDSRVHFSHACKMAAALQAIAARQEHPTPVLLWVDREAGHGQGKPLNLRLRDAADQRIFLMWQLGLLPPAGG